VALQSPISSLHANGWHIFFNMAMLYYFRPGGGTPRCTNRAYRRLLSGMRPGWARGCYLLLWRLHLLIAGPLIGASGRASLGVIGGGHRSRPAHDDHSLVPPVTNPSVDDGADLSADSRSSPSGPPVKTPGGEGRAPGGALIGFLLIRNINWLKRHRGWKESTVRASGNREIRNPVFFREEFRK